MQLHIRMQVPMHANLFGLLAVPTRLRILCEVVAGAGL
jgi:hypothetical protein